RGFLLCVERWGGDDGPDDAIECLNYWPILHAIGADDDILRMYERAWEGHLRQYTLARTTDVPFARDGMYYKEFPVMFDWLHHSEGLTVFNLQGLSDPDDRRFQQRVRRYAGFYIGEDPQAQNYDPQQKIIRSLFNGSRGPLLRKATAVDWAGDPIEVKHRFRLGHGEESYEQMLAHFEEYTDIVGDHPGNMMATALALNAYMLSHEAKYKDWVLEYVGAWRERMRENGGLIPSNIGLDGKIGGGADGKWYGGVYGWGFSVRVPQTGALAHRDTFHLGVHGFLNAALLTGDLSLLDPWRKQLELVNAQRREQDGRTVYPHKYGDEGWYHWQTTPYQGGARELYYFTGREEDRRWIPDTAWMRYLRGEQPNYPVTALRHDLDRVREQVRRIRVDDTTPDTRLADDPMKHNPVSVQALMEQTMGGLYPGKQGLILHARLRYFDPAARRAGLPPGVSALVDRMTDRETAVTLVNTDQLQPKTLIVQAGGYGEHQIESVATGDAATPGVEFAVHGDRLTVRMEPGAGQRLRLRTRKYANPPTLRFPWDAQRVK
ncbi:MAG: hypothetical protein KDE20_13675, partial [Caldilineaceae bacterium]|nr:hypothetical protein [Caldilineaceae bacterium]